MSKVRDLPLKTTLASDDLFYVVDSTVGANGGKKIKKSDLKTQINQSPSEIKTAYESNADTNAFSDAEKSKLAGIEAGATTDQNADEVPYDNSISLLSAVNVQDAIDELNADNLEGFSTRVDTGLIVDYTAGKVSFNGVFSAIVAGAILLNQNITNGYIYVDVDALVKQTASGIYPPPYTYPIARFSTDLTTVLSLLDVRTHANQSLVIGLVSDISTLTPDVATDAGSTNRLADAAHVHNVPTDAPTTALSPSTTNAEGAGSSFARNDHTHAISTAIAGDLSTINAGDTASAGTAANYARGDHQHPVATAVPATLNPDITNTEGVSTSLARADHIHNIPADAPTTTLSPATSNTEGVGTSFARNDHIHAVATALVADITTIQPDDAAAAGTANTFARGDHKHAIVAATAVALNAASTSTEGVSTSFARADHTHALGSALVADITTIQPDDAAAAGTSNNYARGDHRHAIVAAAASSISTSSTNTEGASTSFARADHTHVVTVTTSEATATGDDTTSSLTDALMVSMTLTPAAGTYIVMWTGSIVNSANGTERTFVSIYLGGAQVTATERSIGTSGGAYVPSVAHAIVSPNGSQAVELRWRVAGGTSTVHSRRLSLVKVG